MDIQSQNQENVFSQARSRLASSNSRKMVQYSEKATRVALDMLRECDNVQPRVKY